nr:hypothetical protein [Tanacetum cinerariifolium]
ESVGSSFSRVILIGSISFEVSVAPKVGAVTVASPAEVLKLDTHSSSKVDPLESSLPPVSVASMVLPFLCSNNSRSDTEIPERHVSPTTSILEIPTAPILPSPTPHDAMLTRWRSRVALRSSSPTTSTLEILTAPILPVPYAIVAPSFEFPLAPVVAQPEIHHSSSGHSSSDHSLSVHTPPDTIVADSSTPPSFVHPPLARTPRYSEAYLQLEVYPIIYHVSTDDIRVSLGYSSYESSARPSRKRCRSPAAAMTSSIHATRALVPSCTDLLPPCKRDVKARIDAGIGIKVDLGVDVEDEVEDKVESSNRGTIEVGLDVVARIDIPDGMLMADAVEHLEQVEEGLHDIYNHVIEIPLYRIEGIKTGHRELEARSMIAGGERASLLDQVASLERKHTRLRDTMMMERARTNRFRRCVRFIESEIRQI